MTYEKVAKCNYCGTHAALELKGKKHHELACPTCSAPLHLIHRTPVKPSGAPKPKKSKPRSFKRKMFSEVFDILDDLFD